MASNPAGQVGRHTDAAAHEASPWVERLARLGYAAKGIVYVIIGFLAARAAFGSGGQVTGGSGALQSLADDTWGQIALVVIAIGLAGYVVWRFVQAAMDPENKGDDKAGIAKRIGYVISGVLYGVLAFEAARLVLSGGGGGGGGQGGGSGASHWTAQAMELPLGRWLVGLAGIGTALYGLYQLYKAWTKDFTDSLQIGEVDYHKRQWIVRSGRAGLTSRGIVFGIIGFFLVQAALQYQPGQARGLGGALRTLQGQSYGPWVLGLVAIGLIGYGIFQLVKARYRHIEPA